MRTDLHPDPAYTLADQKRMGAAQRYFRWQARLAEPELGRRVLEVGCGLGNFSAQLGARDLVVGIDADAGCISRWQARFETRPNFLGLLLDAESDEFVTLERYQPDSIACLNVLEHIRRDDLALRNMWQVLRPGGRAVLMVPAFEALYGEIDERLGHYRRYTRRSLATVASGAGFRVVRMKYMNFIGFFGWWVNARIFRRTEQSPEQIAFFDRYVVPVQSRVEEFLAPPIGQSLVAVLEKA